LGFLSLSLVEHLDKLAINLSEFNTIFINGSNGKFDAQMFSIVETIDSSIERYLLIPCFILGLLIIFKKLRNNNFYKLLIVWLFVQLVFYLILNRPTRRYWLSTAPAIFIISAIGINFVVERINEKFKKFIFAIAFVSVVLCVQYEYFTLLKRVDYNLSNEYNNQAIAEFIKKNKISVNEIYIENFDKSHDHLWFYLKNNNLFKFFIKIDRKS
jgi:uncharacterized membrane protein YoaK (UPF0700 family)